MTLSGTSRSRQRILGKTQSLNAFKKPSLDEAYSVTNPYSKACLETACCIIHVKGKEFAQKDLHFSTRVRLEKVQGYFNDMPFSSF